MSYLQKSYLLSTGLNRGLEKIGFSVIINDRREKENVRISLSVRENNGGKKTIHTKAGRMRNLLAHAEQY
jgi:hypothetical protein